MIKKKNTEKTYNFCGLLLSLLAARWSLLSRDFCAGARVFLLCACVRVCNKNKRQKTLNSVEELNERNA